jgi:hypothetical protein
MSATVPTTLQQEEQAAVTLAQTAAQQVMNAAPGSEPAWAKPAVAIFSIVVFVGMMVVAYLTKDQSMIMLLGGSAISMATTAVSYYLGSSSGSAQKNATIAASMPAPVAPIPGATNTTVVTKSAAVPQAPL